VAPTRWFLSAHLGLVSYQTRRLWSIAGVACFVADNVAAQRSEASGRRHGEDWPRHDDECASTEREHHGALYFGPSIGATGSHR
jgi:hypothetical protein